MSKTDLINLYKKESSDVFNSIPSIEIAKFVDMVFDVYENEEYCYNKEKKLKRSCDHKKKQKKKTKSKSNS